MRTLVAPVCTLMLLSTAAVGSPEPSSPPPNSPEAVLGCMSANVPATVRAQSVELVSLERGGATRTLTGRIYASQEESPSQRKRVRAVLQVDGPKDLAGAAYLIRETGVSTRDGVFLFLPSLGSVRKISGASATNSLLGTAFSFQEFKLLLNAFEGVAATVENVGEIDGRAVYIVSFKSDDPEAETGLTRAWIDQKTCVPLRADFYKGDKVQKRATIRADSIKQARDVWYPAEVEMKDLVSGASSTLRATVLEPKEPVPSVVFDITSFYHPYTGP
jgi:hypothetical protein